MLVPVPVVRSPPPAPGCTQVSFKVTDVPGAKPETWHKYYAPKLEASQPAPYAIVFVVDSTAAASFGDARRELNTLLTVRELRDTLFVVVANKQGHLERGAEESDVLIDELGIGGRFDRSIGYITASVAHGGGGLLEILQFIDRSRPNSDIK